MEKKLNSAKLNLLFAKTNLVNELRQNIASQSNDIETILGQWLDDHKDEIEKDCDAPIEWLGEWHRLDGSVPIRLELLVGKCTGPVAPKYQYRDKKAIYVFPDGHWEFPKYNELNDKRME